jgi:hypothetical protein
MGWLWAMIAATLALATPGEDFERGKIAFSRGEYRRAIGILNPLLYPEGRLDSEGEVVQAHRMLGVAHLFENQPEDAQREFRKLLELRPDYRFDPLLDPPRVVEFFNGILKEEENEIASFQANRRKRDSELALRRQREAEAMCAARAPPVVYLKNSYGINFLPFGAGQFQNRQRRKAWTFLGAEAALGAVSLGAFSTNFVLFGLAPRRRCLDAPTGGTTGVAQPCQNIDHSQEALSRDLLHAQLASGGLFFAVAIWGIIDAVRHFQPETALELETRGTSGPGAAGAAGPAGAPGAPNPRPGRGATSRLQAAPFPVAGGSGLGLEWTF